MPELPRFEEIHRTYADAVYRFCLFRTRDPGIAEEVTATVFVSAWRAYEKAPPDIDRVRFWLIGIARNAITDHHRREGRQRRLAVLLRRQRPETSDPEATVAVRGELSDVLRAMEALNDRERHLIALRYGSDLSFAEIGEMLKLNEQAAGAATRRAVAQLRKVMGND